MLQHTKTTCKLTIGWERKLFSSSPKSSCTVCRDIAGKYKTFVARRHCRTVIITYKGKIKIWRNEIVALIYVIATDCQKKNVTNENKFMYFGAVREQNWRGGKIRRWSMLLVTGAQEYDHNVLFFLGEIYKIIWSKIYNMQSASFCGIFDN